MYSQEYNELLNKIEELKEWLIKNTPTVLELKLVRNEIAEIVLQMQKLISVNEARYRDNKNNIQLHKLEIDNLRSEFNEFKQNIERQLQDILEQLNELKK